MAASASSATGVTGPTSPAGVVATRGTVGQSGSTARWLPVTGWATIVLLVVLGAAALGGGWALLNPAPDGNALGMSVDLLQHSPFTSYVVPGALLFGVFGVGSLATALIGALRHWTAPYLAFALGVGQMIWIAVELAMVQVLHPVMHPALFTWGAAIAVLSYFWWRVTSHSRLA